MLDRPRALVAFGLLLLLAQAAMAAQTAATTPADFYDAPVANVPSPTALAFTPDGRMLITQQTGHLRVYQDGRLLAKSALDLTVGDKICKNSERGLLGVAVDPEFNQNHFIGSHLRWRVILHHNDHTHPYWPPTAGISVTITAPGPEDLAATATSYLEIELTATDSLGLSDVVTRTLRPRLVDVTFVTVPAGLRLLVNDGAITAPVTLTSWDGYALTVFGPAQRDGGGQLMALASWADGGAVPSRTIATPSSPTTYTATFAPANLVLLPLIEK